MKRKKQITDKSPSLRQKAEEKFHPRSVDGLSKAEVHKLAHELQVQQVELQMQSGELRAAQVALEESRNKYSDLYDFAPLGYLSLDKKGAILECNLTFAGQIGRERRLLAKAPFLRFVHKEDQNDFYRHLLKVFSKKESQTCEIRLLRGDGTEF